MTEAHRELIIEQVKEVAYLAYKHGVERHDGTTPEPLRLDFEDYWDNGLVPMLKSAGCFPLFND